MINLIKNEFIKILNKKGIYITLLIILGFMVFYNMIYKSMSKIDNAYDNEYTIEYLTELKHAVENSGKITPDEYINLKTNIEKISLGIKYDKEWMHYILENKLYEIILNMNSTNKDSDDYEYYKKEYDVIINAFKNDNWKEILIYEKNNKKIDKDELFKINYRLDNNLPFGGDYLNIALEEYNSNFPTYNQFVKSIKSNENSISANKLKDEYNSQLKNNKINKYILDSKYNINNTINNRYILMNIEEEYSIVILILILIVSGTIVSTEFDKGTIKQLLIKPYSRTKILLSKYIVTLIFVLISFIIIILLQYIIGGIILGFESLNIPAVIYNFSLNEVVAMNIFKYILITVLLVLPKYILLTTLAFAISTIFNNSVLGVIVPVLGLIGSNIINLLATSHTIKYMNYVITLNWDFNEYLYGKIPPFKGVSLKFSIIMCIIYMLIMLIPSFIIFKKRDIKNI